MSFAAVNAARARMPTATNSSPSPTVAAHSHESGAMNSERNLRPFDRPIRRRA
jgi:hypothetical protein